MEHLKNMIRQYVSDAITEAFGGSPARETVGRAEVVGNNREVVADVARAIAAATPKRRTRRVAPAVGYSARINGRKKRPAWLSHNLDVVLADVVKHPGTTNRAITERLGDQLGGKKAVESALYALRTHDESGKNLGPGVHKRSLVYSEPLE